MYASINKSQTFQLFQVIVMKMFMFLQHPWWHGVPLVYTFYDPQHRRDKSIKYVSLLFAENAICLVEVFY